MSGYGDYQLLLIVVLIDNSSPIVSLLDNLVIILTYDYGVFCFKMKGN